MSKMKIFRSKSAFWLAISNSVGRDRKTQIMQKSWILRIIQNILFFLIIRVFRFGLKEMDIGFVFCMSKYANLILKNSFWSFFFVSYGIIAWYSGLSTVSFDTENSMNWRDFIQFSLTCRIQIQYPFPSVGSGVGSGNPDNPENFCFIRPLFWRL